MPGLRQAAPLLMHHALAQLGNVARLNGNFDRSNVAHVDATDLFNTLMAGDELDADQKHELLISQVNNLRNHGEELRKVAVSGPGQAGRNLLRESLKRADESLVLIRQYDLGGDEEAASCMYRGRAMISMFGLEMPVNDGLMRAYLMLINPETKPHNPYYRLYCELDWVEVECYKSETSKLELIVTALFDLGTSLRYGNRWPRPLHFERAVFNLAMCLTPLRLRRRILRRYGRLISTIPSQTAIDNE